MPKRATGLLALALVAGALTGCVQEPSKDFVNAPSEGAGDRAKRPDLGPAFDAFVAAWRQPDLYGAVDAVANASHVEVHDARDSPGMDLPPIPARGGEWPQEGRLLRGLGWHAPPFAHDDANASHHFGVSGTDEGALRIRAQVTAHEPEALRVHFDALVTNLTDANATTRDAWFARFLDSREDVAERPPGVPEDAECANGYCSWTNNGTRFGVSYMSAGYDHAYEVTMNRAVLLDRMSARFAENGTRTEEARFGELTVNWTLRDGSGWVLLFGFPPRDVTLTTTEHGLIGLTLTALGDVRLYAADPAIVPEENARAWIRGAFEDAGLPEPTFEAWRAAAEADGDGRSLT